MRHWFEHNGERPRRRARQSHCGICACHMPRPLPGRCIRRMLPRGGGDRGNLLVGRDLIQQVRQHRSVANIACRDANCPDLQSFFILSKVNIAR